MESEETKNCHDKLAFDTKKEANASAVVAEYQHGTKLKVYKCKDCNLWHLASDFSG